MRNCPACNGDGKIIGTKNDFAIRSCLSCASIFTSETEEQSYDNYFDASQFNVPDFIKERMREIVGQFESYRKTERLLDIGFGAGTILESADEWEAYGVEVSKAAADRGKEKGWKVFHGYLEDAGYPDDHFDVVTASEIVEHLTDPRPLLREVRRILRPGGLFWATTPSATGLSYKLLGTEWVMIAPPEHLQLFSRKAVKRMFRDEGFSTTIRTHGFNPAALFKPKKSLETTYAINETLSATPNRKHLKTFLNFGLNLTRLGDTLKIWAVKHG